MNMEKYNKYIDILRTELVPALGCTEPIAIAYAGAKAREVLGCMPDHVVVECSGNIIKNVKGVIVPTTESLKGVEPSAILGIVAGDASKKMEVLANVKPEDVEKTRQLMQQKGYCEVKLIKGESNLQIIVHVFHGKDEAIAEICYSHTNIVRLEKNGEILFQVDKEDPNQGHADYSVLNFKDIYEFAETVKIEDVKDILDPQIKYNTAIAQEGLTHPWGACVGATLLEEYGDDIKVKARALAAAGSDARMSGCPLPVVVNSGSGNQGMTVSLPVLAYAEHLKVSEEKKYRALVLSNLLAVYQKSWIGKLSAYCGAVSAGCASGAAITYLCGGNLEQIAQTIINTLGNTSGIVCDGAKPSCAAKIATSVDAAILGHEMAMKGRGFSAGEGLVMDNIEDTIQAIGRMGREGMKETDIEILHIMIGQ